MNGVFFFFLGGEGGFGCFFCFVWGFGENFYYIYIYLNSFLSLYITQVCVLLFFLPCGFSFRLLFGMRDKSTPGDTPPAQPLKTTPSNIWNFSKVPLQPTNTLKTWFCLRIFFILGQTKVPLFFFLRVLKQIQEKAPLKNHQETKRITAQKKNQAESLPGHPKVPCFLEVFCYIKPPKKHSFGCLGMSHRPRPSAGLTEGFSSSPCLGCFMASWWRVATRSKGQRFFGESHL